MPDVTRRAALSAPLLLLPVAAGRAALLVPLFPYWIGRTALLRGDGGAAKLLLDEDGTGLMTVRLFILCRSLPIHRWQFGEDGLSVRYSRVSALDSRRIITGEAHILPEPGQVLWIEAARHQAEFQGFAERESARSCF